MACRPVQDRHRIAHQLLTIVLKSVPMIFSTTIGRRVPMAVIGLTAALTVLSACGSSSSADEGPQVAALPSTASASSDSATPKPQKSTNAVVDRVLPLGATQQEIDRAYDAWYACWIKEGIPSDKDGGPLMTYKKNTKKYQAARDRCDDQEPLNAPELDPATNPGYWDQLRDELRCVKEKGLPLAVRPGSPGLWVDPPTDANYHKVQTDEAAQIQRECELKAFS
jgi:hypothetical protein